jgi:hypothetical protein
MGGKQAVKVTVPPFVTTNPLTEAVEYPVPVALAL